MRDFTLDIYELILKSFGLKRYAFSTFENYFSRYKKKVVLLRHDVDRLPENALKIAALENRLGIKASYYFRMVKESYDENIIRQIMDMGHEIGYHYENLTTCGGDLRLAIDDFRLNLEKLREICPVKTICMHGSPFSKYDNKNIWEKYDYRDYGIIAEPYFDIDFNEVFYLTDSGRSWNKSATSVRDKVNSKFDIKIKNTQDLIEKIQNNELPDKIMMNVHPQRWDNRFGPWVRELVWQNVKNVVKRLLVRRTER